MEILPENFAAFQLLSRIGTRWNVGMSGVIGIRHEAVYPLMDRMNLEPDEWDALLADLEVMERAAIPVINEK